MVANTSLRNGKQTQTVFVGSGYESTAARGPLLDKVFSLRYKSYSAENYIDKNSSGRFMDEYDGQRNCQSYLTYFRKKPIGSIRSCVYSPDGPTVLPAMHPFEEEIRECLGYEEPFVEANRFVVDPDFQRQGGVVARFNIFRKIVESAIEAEAPCILAAIRPEHVKFYRLLFFYPLADIAPKPYPALKFKVVLLACRDIARLKKLIWSRTSK